MIRRLAVKRLAVGRLLTSRLMALGLMTGCLTVFAMVVAVVEVRADEMAPPQDSTATLANPLAAHSLDEFAATRDRPLFTRGRRQPDPPAPATVASLPPEPPAPPDVAFFGTLVDSEGASAIVRGAPADKVEHVHVGDKIHGWTIERIDDRQLVLSLEDHSTTFTMFNAGHAAVHTVAMGHPPPILEVNSAGILRAHRVTKHLQ
jgi:general secretion pathway protein N